jgi:hypothetical protein
MGTRSALLSMALVLAIGAAVHAAPGKELARVRPLDQRAASLLASAQEKSATVRALVTTIQDSDIVAYVQVVPAVEGRPASGLQFVGNSAAARFVLIQVADGGAAGRAIENLGRELERAREVAGMAWVTDNDKLQRMLTLTGWPAPETARGYDTSGAAHTARTVRREVGGAIGSAQ